MRIEGERKGQGKQGIGNRIIGPPPETGQASLPVVGVLLQDGTHERFGDRDKEKGA